MEYLALQSLMAALEQDKPVALATVTGVQGASPARPGFKLLVYPDGTAAGNVGGGELEARIRQDALVSLENGEAKTTHYALREEGVDAIGMLCGGEVTVFIEPYLPAPILLIAGGGHIGRPLADLARTVGYHIQTVDVLTERGEQTQLAPEAVTSYTYAVLITEDHTTDEAALRLLLSTPVRYIGMIGSRRKAATILGHLRSDGYTDTLLAQPIHPGDQTLHKPGSWWVNAVVQQCVLGNRLNGHHKAQIFHVHGRNRDKA
jgi:xanthine dehydrogenase accessory factor